MGLRLDVEKLRRPSKGKTLRVQSSDDCPRAKPSGFRAPTTVRGQNPQGSELRRPSKGQTLRVRSSDDRPRAKPSGFGAPTTVQGQNPQGSELRRPSKGKTLRVQSFDDRPRETLYSSRSLVSLLLRPPRWFAAQGVAAISDRQPYDASPPRVLEHHVKNKIDEK